MRSASLLLSLVVAAAALVLPAAARINYYKGLTTVDDLETLRVLDGEGRFRKHTLVAFMLPDTDGSAACALDQLEALRFPHVFFHLPGTIFEMVQVFVDPSTELTQKLLPKASHKDACHSFLFIPQNTTVAGAAQGAEADGRRLVAQSQGELEGWFWGLQCAATGPFAFTNDFPTVLSVYRETRRPRALEMERVMVTKTGNMGGELGAKDSREMENFLVTVKPGERVVFNATHPICRGHKVTFRRFGGRLLARLIVGDEDLLPGSYVPTSANASEEGGVTAMGLREWVSSQNPAWDPRRLQLTDELADLYKTRVEYNFKRMERMEHAPRRAAVLMKEGYVKERVPQSTWEVFVEKYEKANEERKHKPDLNEAMTLRIENVRVPLATAIQRNRNMNPPPVSTMFGNFGSNDTIWDAMVNGLKPRILELLDGHEFRSMHMSALRRYYNGTMVRDHVQAAEGIAAIVNVGQDVDEPWELHLLDPEGRRHRITMEPGDVMLYQTDRIAQGHPLPIVGKYYDNMLFLARAQDAERRPLSSVEAGLAPLELNELPSGAVAVRAAEEGEGFEKEL